jgi:hypothetical protein
MLNACAGYLLRLVLRLSYSAGYSVVSAVSETATEGQSLGTTWGLDVRSI